jgi:hypothetical protein
MTKFANIALLSAAACTAAVAIVMALPLDEPTRSTTLLGVALSGASGGIALVVKRRSLARNGLTAVLGALTFMFFVRGALLALGLTFVVRGDGVELAFVAGFFAVYFIQQTLELTWVVAESKKKTGVPAT